MVNESIIVGLVVGGGVAVIGTLISHLLRLREMEAHWAEEERRRKSDRRREAYEEELRLVSDSLYAFMKAIEMSLTFMGEGEEWKSRARLIDEVNLTTWESDIVAMSLGDQGLTDTYGKLRGNFERWVKLLDFKTGEAAGGKEAEFQELIVEMMVEASKVRRRIRKLREEA